MDIGKPAIDAVVTNGQSFVVEAQLVEDRRVDVVDGFLRVAILWAEAPLVAMTVGAALDATATQPVGEHKGVVVSPGASLRAWHATKLSGPKDDGVFQ